MAGDALRVRIEWGTDDGGPDEGRDEGLGAVLRAALDLLDGGGRIRLVGAGQAADIVHTVGGTAAPGAVRARDGVEHRVHTLPSVPPPTRHMPGWWWGRRERRRAGAPATWLAHGRVAAQLLVASRAVPGEQVHWLPIVAPLSCRADGPVDRGAVRARLGVPPGVVLVVECPPTGGPEAAPGWERFVAADHREVMTLRCALPVSAPAPANVSPSPSPSPTGRLTAPTAPTAHHLSSPDATFPELLAAADLFVAARRALTAANPGVAAVAAGVPVIAVTTDSTAELVRSGRNGFVVPPDPAAVAEAVHAYLAGELPHARIPAMAAAAAREPDRVLEELARGLLRAYHCALIHHGGRRAADRGVDRGVDRRTDRATAAGPDPVPAG